MKQVLFFCKSKITKDKLSNLLQELYYQYFENFYNRDQSMFIVKIENQKDEDNIELITNKLIDYNIDIFRKV